MSTCRDDIQLFVVACLHEVDPVSAEQWPITSIHKDKANAILRKCEAKFGGSFLRYGRFVAVSELIDDVYQQFINRR